MEAAENTNQISDDVGHYSFVKVEKTQQHVHDVEVLRSLRQWGLLQFMTMETYSFPEEYKDSVDTNRFMKDLFADDEFVETFVIPSAGGRNYRFPVPNSPIYEKSLVTSFSRSFFEPFHTNGPLANSGRLAGCETKEIDIGKDKPITIHAQLVALKSLLTKEEDEFGEDEDVDDVEYREMLPKGFRKELLGKIITILFVGGGLNQYSNNFNEYERAATLIYRDLITAKRMNDGCVGTECCVYEIKGLGDIQNYDLFPIEPSSRFGNLCVVSIHPGKHLVTVFHVGYKKAY